MTDTVSKKIRSKIMSSVSGKNTKPEILLRSLLHRAGYRFRIHSQHLPGKPDIYLPKFRTVIFVHGCFWHRHVGCKKTTTPRSNKKFWDQKFRDNKARDARNERLLKKSGFTVLTVWECELKNPQKVLSSLRKTLNSQLRKLRRKKSTP